MPVAEPTTADALALVRAGGPAYHEHVDEQLVRRLAALAAGVVALGVVVLAGVAPPAAWAWPVAAATVVLAVAVTAVLIRGRGPVRFGRLYASSLALIAGVCAIDGAAGADPPYRQLLLLQLIAVCATHVPRRAAAALALAAAGLLVPVALRGWPLDDVLEWATRAVVWSLCGAMAVLWTASVRVQRAALLRYSQAADALARVDALTGLGNRRAFDEALGREIARAHRAGAPLAIALGDVDHFKAINDRIGHSEGDRVLQGVAAALRATVRGPDLCFRWAGDEFALILPGAGIASASAAAERVADALEVGISFGCAELAGGIGAIELLDEADRALRECKAVR